MNFILVAALKKLIITSDFKSVQTKFVDRGADEEDVKKYLNDFKTLRDRDKIKSLDEKNIDHWGKKSWEEFKEFVDKLSGEKTKTEERKLKKMAGAQLYAENDDWYVYRILTHEASKIYGSETKWCITQETSTHFDSYVTNHNIYFYISKHLDSTDSWYKIAALIEKNGTTSYWDAKDKKFNKIPSQLNTPKDPLKKWTTIIKTKIDGKEYEPQDIPPNSTINRSLDLSHQNLKKIPENLTIKGIFNISGNPITEVPKVSVRFAESNIGGNRDFICENNILTKISPDIDAANISFKGSTIEYLPEFSNAILKLDLTNAIVKKIDPAIAADMIVFKNCTIDHLPKLKNVRKLVLTGIKVNTLEIDPGLDTLDLTGIKLKKLEAYNLKTLILTNSRIEKIDPNLKVSEILDLNNARIKKLPDNLTVKELYLKGSNLSELPKNLKVSRLDLTNSKVKSLNVEGLKFDWVNIEGSEVAEVGPDVAFEDLYHNKNTFKETWLKKIPFLRDPNRVWPGLNISNSFVEQLPDKLIIDGDFLLFNNPQLTKLPKFLKVSGTLSIAKTGITKLPANLHVKLLIMDKALDIPKTAKIETMHIKR